MAQAITRLGTGVEGRRPSCRRWGCPGIADDACGCHGVIPTQRENLGLPFSAVPRCIAGWLSAGGLAAAGQGRPVLLNRQAGRCDSRQHRWHAAGDHPKFAWFRRSKTHCAPAVILNGKNNAPYADGAGNSDDLVPEDHRKTRSRPRRPRRAASDSGWRRVRGLNTAASRGGRQLVAAAA